MNHSDFEQMKLYRRQLLDTPNGRKVLTDMLRKMGLFRSKAELKSRIEADPAVVRSLLNGIGLLEELGVWTDDNFGRLVEAMATLPLPDLENNNGET